jgi:hypothetical protein
MLPERCLNGIARLKSDEFSSQHTCKLSQSQILLLDGPHIVRSRNVRSNTEGLQYSSVAKRFPIEEIERCLQKSRVTQLLV